MELKSRCFRYWVACWLKCKEAVLLCSPGLAADCSKHGEAPAMMPACRHHASSNTSDKWEHVHIITRLSCTDSRLPAPSQIPIAAQPTTPCAPLDHLVPQPASHQCCSRMQCHL